MMNGLKKAMVNEVMVCPPALVLIGRAETHGKT